MTSKPIHKRPLFWLGLMSLLAAMYFGFDMFKMHQNGALWGKRPLYFFATAWLSILFFFRPSRLLKDKELSLLAVASGGLLALAFPPMGGAFFIFFALIPLLLIEDYLFQSKKKPSRGRMFRFSLITFVTFNIFTTWWIANTSFGSGVFAIIANSLLMTIPWVLFHQSRKVLGDRLGYMALVGFWLTFEYLHFRWELTWPWLTFGNAFAQFPKAIQWYEFTGALGGSLWILVLNISFFWIVKNPINVLKHGSFALAAMVLPVLLSVFIYNSYKEASWPVNFVLVQPNYEPHYTKYSIPASQQLEHYKDLTLSQIDEETDYVLFPENSLGIAVTLWEGEIEQYRDVDFFRKEITNKYPKVKLLSGISSHEKFDPKEAMPSFARKGPFGKVYYASYNTAIQLENGQSEIPIYHKSKLVPGAERLPYWNLFKWTAPLVEKFGGMPGSFGTQKDREVFVSKDGSQKIAPVICYESVFGDYLAGYVRNGAQAIAIITNDGWWDQTAGYKQHLAYASLRAIETRRSVARAANSGVSCFVNQRGDILQASSYDEIASIKGSINFNDKITFYVKNGDLIGRIAAFLGLLLLSLTLVRNTVKKKPKVAR